MAPFPSGQESVSLVNRGLSWSERSGSDKFGVIATAVIVPAVLGICLYWGLKKAKTDRDVDKQDVGTEFPKSQPSVLKLQLPERPTQEIQRQPSGASQYQRAQPAQHPPKSILKNSIPAAAERPRSQSTPPSQPSPTLKPTIRQVQSSFGSAPQVFLRPGHFQNHALFPPPPPPPPQQPQAFAPGLQTQHSQQPFATSYQTAPFTQQPPLGLHPPTPGFLRRAMQHPVGAPVALSQCPRVQYSSKPQDRVLVPGKTRDGFPPAEKYVRPRQPSSLWQRLRCKLSPGYAETVESSNPSLPRFHSKSQKEYLERPASRDSGHKPPITNHREPLGLAVQQREYRAVDRKQQRKERLLPMDAPQDSAGIMDFMEERTEVGSQHGGHNNRYRTRASSVAFPTLPRHSPAARPFSSRHPYRSRLRSPTPHRNRISAIRGPVPAGRRKRHAGDHP
ncbi:hypothetical protein MKZ38_007579 [Zalerion maritima]|uniref:Uncharacterized protein n=1 Tax=Zalerion maritima TaxID=339359 RepID=A0AAD5RVT4_9PEZI|nr:hypothetical protein MKZ38_007579 [Zalerion maritima]